MTAIVGLVHGRHVYLGGDSGSSDGWAEQEVTAAKVFRNGPYIIGYTTSFRMGQLLQHALQPPTPPQSAAFALLDGFMCTDFVNAVRQALKNGGWRESEKEREKGGQFLVGVNGHLFVVQAEFSVIAYRAGYAAVGSGYLTALGSLHTTASTGWGARRRVTLALQAAAEHAAGVRGPFHIERSS